MSPYIDIFPTCLQTVLFADILKTGIDDNPISIVLAFLSSLFPPFKSNLMEDRPTSHLFDCHPQNFNLVVIFLFVHNTVPLSQSLDDQWYHF